HAGALNQPLYDGEQENWIRERIDLNGFIGQEVSLRFQIRSDGLIQRDGFYFDQFKVSVLRSTPSSLGLLDIHQSMRIFPNPTDHYLNIATELTHYQYRLVDALGRIKRQAQVSGPARIDLEGLPPGLYQIHIDYGQRQAVFPVVVGN
ncbi:MAG: T9SS type A sorting domain-containing protein, partial [Bacteroidota bacterium]